MQFPGFLLAELGSVRLWALDIPRLQRRHLANLLEVYRQCEDFLALGPQPRASLAMLQTDLEHARTNGRCFCALSFGGCTAGVVDFLPTGFEGQTCLAFIELLMVAAPFRGRGIGAQVVEMFESLARTHGARAILTAVQQNNLPALRFWERCGFRIVSGPTLQPDTTITYRLEKELNPDQP